MDFGVQSEGFVPKRYKDIEGSVFNSYRQNIDPSINTSIGQPPEQISTPHINEQTTVWEALQDLSAIFDLDQCYGIWLDYYVQKAGLIRIGAVPTQLQLSFQGAEGTNVNESFRAEDENGVQYKPLTAFTIATQNVLEAIFQIPTPLTDPTQEPYTINLDGVDYEWNAPTSDPEAIRDGLFVLIDATGDYICEKLGTDAFSVKIFTNRSMNFTVTDNINWFNTAQCESVEAGKFVTAVGQCDKIKTPVTGLDEVYNYYESTLGRDPETDAELKIRYRQSLVTGDGTVDAVVSNILNYVEGVISCQGYENVEDITVDGLPPHSLYIVCDGGLAQDVAERIYKHKPAGIQTFGQQQVTVLTANGDPFQIFFDRVTVKYLWIRCTISPDTQDPPPFPDNGRETAKQILYDTSVAIQNIGSDAIAQKYVGPLYKGLDGIRNIIMEVALTDSPNDTPNYVTSYETVLRNEQAVATLDRIIVL